MVEAKDPRYTEELRSLEGTSLQSLTRITFRKFQEDDLIAVQDLHVSSFRQLARNHHSDQEIAALEKLFRGSSYLGTLCESNITLAIVDDNIVGSVGWFSLDPVTARIRKLFVSPDYANRGLGRQLLDHVENEIRNSGLFEIVLRASINAVLFYEKAGFTQIKSETMLLADNISVPVMTMRKRLEKF